MNAKTPLPLFRSAHWMLLALVLSLLVSFWVGSSKFGKHIEDTYNDPYRLAALKTLESAVESVVPSENSVEALSKKQVKDAFPGGTDDRLSVLTADLNRLQEKLRSISPPGKRLRLNLEQWKTRFTDVRDIEELISAVHWLSQSQRIMLMNWPGLRSKSSMMPMKVPDNIFQQENPWRGANGCIYLRSGSEREIYFLEEQTNSRELCEAMTPRDSKKRRPLIGIKTYGKGEGGSSGDLQVPPDLNLILRGVDSLRSASGQMYRDYMLAKQEQSENSNKADFDRNKVLFRGRSREIGLNVHITIDPPTQELVQTWALCYTGRNKECLSQGIDRHDPLWSMSEEMYEHSAMRMVAIAVIDVETGNIEGLGSAHTDCYRQDHSGLSHSKSCPDTPFRPRYDEDRLNNHALYVDAMPASTIKPILALAFLEDSSGFRSGALLDELSQDLKTSNSADFLDRLFCGDSSAKSPWHWEKCNRPKRVQTLATAMGWNGGCKGHPGLNCGRRDVMFGNAGDALAESDEGTQARAILYGRIFTKPIDAIENDELEKRGLDSNETRSIGVGTYGLIGDFRFSAEKVKQCSEGQFCDDCRGTKRWRRCRGGGTLVNEGWGQGEARATTLGVAGMMASMAASSNGQKEKSFPHLVDHISDANGQLVSKASVGITAEPNIFVEEDLARKVLTGMQSHRSDGTAYLACKNVFNSAECNEIDWIAGKTGTPPFRFDEDTLKKVREICYKDSGTPKAECNMFPYKWYVAAFNSGQVEQGKFDKVIAVLSERNWRKTSGLVQAPGDREVNLSAELAMRIMHHIRTQTEKKSSVSKSGVHL